MIVLKSARWKTFSIWKNNIDNVLDEEKYFARLLKEAEMVRSEYPTFSTVNNDPTHYEGYIRGTGVYKDGFFCFEIKIPRDYPFKPPNVIWKTPIFHPNIKTESRRVCIGILGKDWRPRFSIVDVIVMIQHLLANPNPNDPLRGDVARLFKENFEEFKKQAQEMVKRYATRDQECIKN